MFHTAESPEAEYSDTLELDLSTVEPSLAGPRRPQDRVPLHDVEDGVSGRPQRAAIGPARQEGAGRRVVAGHRAIRFRRRGHGDRRRRAAIADDTTDTRRTITHGSVVIAAITSCTNTSNPSVMVAAGLLAKKAVEKGLKTKPWVKASLAPGSKVVTDYLHDAGLDTYLDQLRFNLVGYGCTTCIGNSGPLPARSARRSRNTTWSPSPSCRGNRNFEGRINPDVRANYLASPPLVVAYALAGTMDIDLQNEPLGTDRQGQARLLEGHLAQPARDRRTRS